MNTKSLLSIAVSSLSVLIAAAPALANQVTDRLRDQSRQALQGRYYTEPAACHDGWLTESDNYIVALEPWAEAAGLRRGDRLDLIQGHETNNGWEDAMPRRRPDSGVLPLRVNRDGQNVDV